MVARTHRQWNVIEFIDLGPEFIGGKAVPPLQLLRYAGTQPEPDSSLWVLSGFAGSSKKDFFLAGLLQKAVQTGVINPVADLFMTPLMNPASDPKNASLNVDGVDLSKAFPLADEYVEQKEIRSLVSWAKRIAPKAIISLTTGASTLIRHSENVPAEIISRLSELCECPALLWGTEPEVNGAAPNQLGSWCQRQGIAWIEFSVEESKKNFQEIAETEWKKHIGSALKWLAEGHRFNPPKEEPLIMKHMIVPVLDIPPEFANL